MTELTEPWQRVWDKKPVVVTAIAQDDDQETSEEELSAAEVDRWLNRGRRVELSDDEDAVIADDTHPFGVTPPDLEASLDDDAPPEEEAFHRRDLPGAVSAAAAHLQPGDEFQCHFAGDDLSPGEFHLHLTESEHFGHFIRMHDEMQGYDFNDCASFPLRPGLLVVVQEAKERLRAEFLGLEDGGQARVRLVDYGDVVKVDAGTVKLLPRKFCRLAPAAVPSKLFGVSVPQGCISYPAAAADTMLEFKHNKTVASPFTAVLLEKRGSVLEVDVFAEEGDAESMLGSILVNAGLARDKALEAEAEKAPKEENLDSLAREMEEEYRSHTNFYEASRKLDAFDLPRDDVVHTEEFGDVRICRFYRENGSCYKGDACEDLHTYTGQGFCYNGRPVRVLTVAHHEIDPPAAGNHAYVIVTTVVHPGSFYVVFPHGLADPTAPEEDGRRSGAEEDGETLESLEKAMRDFYRSHQRQHRKTEVYASELVCVRRGDAYYRARVIIAEADVGDEDDGSSGAEALVQADRVVVQLVDYGTQLMVSQADLWQLKERFLHLPLQAVECCLAGTAPAGKDGWDAAAIKRFRELSVNQGLLLARVSCHSPQLSVELYNEDGKSLSRVLVEEGLVAEAPVFDAKDTKGAPIPG